MADGQLALHFPFRQRLGAEDFLPHSGATLALEFLTATATWPRSQLALWGERGVGKTHLLHIWAKDAGAAVLQGARLEEPFWPESAVALDDADQVPSEETLLHVVNAASEARHPILLTLSRAPGRGTWRLPDLASRMRAITAIEIGRGDDAFLADPFARLLAERQLTVSPAVRSWILTRLPRTPARVRAVVARLDHASLVERKNVTPRFAESVLTDLLDSVPEGST